MTTQRIDIASIRRDQIVEAAVAIITEQGLQNLSLSEIEQRAGMSRGQLTYYFPTKEDILLAVFDRLLLLMYERMGKLGDGTCEEIGHAMPFIRSLTERLLEGAPLGNEFRCLQYTFLSQVGYRQDFRKRLATLYEEWRSHMGSGLEADYARRLQARGISPRTLASFVQAFLHGMTMQLAVDENAFDRAEMLNLCLDMLSTYLMTARPDDRPARPPRKAPVRKKTATNGSQIASGRRPAVRSRGPKP